MYSPYQQVLQLVITNESKPPNFATTDIGSLHKTFKFRITTASGCPSLSVRLGPGTIYLQLMNYFFPMLTTLANLFGLVLKPLTSGGCVFSRPPRLFLVV